MVIDAVGPVCPPVHVSHQSNENGTGMNSNDRGGSFLDAVNATDQPLYSGSENHSQLSAVNRVMCHPSDAEAWKHFDETHPDFATKPRYVRLGLCVDSFAPHGMCMKPEYMFLTLIIPDPANPQRLIDVYLLPLIEELVQLWHVAYGMLSSWSTAGIIGHPYRREKKAFMKGRVEKNEAPPIANGEEVWHYVRYFKSAIEDPVSYPPGYGTEHK
ncbi:hypothetical protein Sango_2749400, partial [Sesamum angolense]